MESSLLLTTKETSAVNKTVKTSNILALLNEIESQTKWKIFEMIDDVQKGIAKTYSISREKPTMSLFIYGRESKISITFQTKGKEAKMLIPKGMNIPPKK